MTAPSTPNRRDKDDTLGVIRDLLRRHSILATDLVDPVATRVTFKVTSRYSVVGLSAAEPGLPQSLCDHLTALGVSSDQKLKRTAIIAQVDSIFQPMDFLIMSSRFGSGFDRFLLLNNAAVEACEAVGLKFNVVGWTHEYDMVNPRILLTCTY